MIEHEIFQIFIIRKSKHEFSLYKHGYEATYLKRWFQKNHYEYLGDQKGAERKDLTPKRDL